MTLDSAVADLLAAIESRDLRRVATALTPDATWQNVPHDPAVGREAVVEMLSVVLRLADRVEWPVQSAASSGATSWVERRDRFEIDGVVHEVRCLGVFEVRDGRVAAVRDYVDLGEWRARIAPVLASCAGRSALDVIGRHIAGVRSGDVAAMAADYALDAKLVRSEERYVGWPTIADYFDTVPSRLGDRSVRFAEPRLLDDGKVALDWTVEAPDGTPIAKGCDTFEVVDGWIVRQLVELASPDF